jgi:hypothetical protein
MSEPSLPVPSAVRWAHGWQRLSRSAIDQGMRHYLRGCANVAMAHSLPEAWVALSEAQNDLIRHSAGTLAEAIELWRKQNSERVRS